MFSSVGWAVHWRTCSRILRRENQTNRNTGYAIAINNPNPMEIA